MIKLFQATGVSEARMPPYIGPAIAVRIERGEMNAATVYRTEHCVGPQTPQSRH